MRMVSYQIKKRFSLFFFLILAYTHGLLSSASGDTPAVKQLTNLIPDTYASIEQSDLSHESDTFILINDFHYNYQAQTNIAHIIDNLVRNHNYELILTEGGAGNLNLSHLRVLAPSQIRNKVAGKYLKKGFISGEEYLDVVADYPFLIEGLEEQNLYRRNVEAFFDSTTLTDKLKPFIEKINAVITDLKTEIYPAYLLRFEKVYRAFNDGQVSFYAYAHYLKKCCAEQNISTADFKQLDAFIVLSEYLDGVDQSVIRSVIGQYLKSAQSASPQVDVNWDALFVLSQYEAIDVLMDKLEDVKNKSGVGFGEYTQLSVYREKLQAYKNLDIFHIRTDVKNLENLFYSSSLTSASQRQLYKLGKDISLFTDLINLSLSRKEYEYYQDNVSWFQPTLWLSVLERLADQYLIDAVIPSADFITYGLLDKIDRFYQLATRRDDWFLANMNRILQRHGKSKAVIIVGGFHKDIFVDYFKKTKLNYIVVSPDFSTLAPTCDYRDIFRKKQPVVDQSLALEKQYLDLQATRGSSVEVALAVELRDMAKAEHIVAPHIKKAIEDGRAFVIKNIRDVDLDELFSMEPAELALALTEDMEGITDDILEDMARKLRGPPGEGLIAELKSGFELIQETVKEAIKEKQPAKIAPGYLIALPDPHNPESFLPDESLSDLLRQPSGLGLVYVDTKTIEYALRDKQMRYRLKRVLKSDALSLGDSFYVPQGFEQTHLRTFWRGVRAYINGIPHREYVFKKTSTNTQSQFFVTQQANVIIVENMADSKDIEVIDKNRFPQLYSIETVSGRPRENVSLLPFFADGVGSSIRWIHMIRGIKRANPDEFLSLVLFDIPQNREFTIKQLEGVVDEVIWIKPEEPLVTNAMHVMSHYRIKDAHRVIWELLIQHIIDVDPSIRKAYPFEHFVNQYDFSQHHPDLDSSQTTVYAHAYFDIDKMAEFVVDEQAMQTADSFYAQLGIDPDKDMVIGYNLRLDMSLTDPSRNSNLYDTIKFVKLLQDKVFRMTGKRPKILFFGNSPLSLANQLLQELSRVEKSTQDESYFQRIKSLTFDLLNAARELHELISDDPDLIDFTNIWQMEYNYFERTYDLQEQAAILGRATFVTGTNSGALDIPLALGVPGVRLTEYHYLGYNEFLAKDLTINVRPVESVKSTANTFINLVRGRGVDTFLNFLASPAVTNDAKAVSRAYDEMLSYIQEKQYEMHPSTPKNIYHVKRRNVLFAQVPAIHTIRRMDKYHPSKQLPGIVKGLARWGVAGLDDYLRMDTSTAQEKLMPGRLDFIFEQLQVAYPPISIPVYFGFQSLSLSSARNYFVALTPDLKIPHNRLYDADPQRYTYLAQARNILVWDKSQRNKLVSQFPQFEDKIILMDQAFPPSIPRALLGIPKVRYDNMASQLIQLLDSTADTLFSALKDQYREKNRRKIAQALNHKVTQYTLQHLNDFAWGRDLGDRIDEYFERLGDKDAVDDINYIGIWFLCEDNQLLTDFIPYTVRVTDCIELEHETLKILFGINIFESEAIMYQAYRAIIEDGADIAPLANLIRFKASVIRTIATERLSELNASEEYNSFVRKENELLANFFQAYNIVAKDITPFTTDMKVSPRKLISPRQLLATSL